MPEDLREVAEVMGIGEENVHALPKIKFKGNFLNPWGNEWPDIFGALQLTRGQTALDIPCGQGGVSVYLAKEYGVAVDGCDLLQGFVDNAIAYAAEQNVQNLCRFFADDLRNVVQAGGEYDLVLWSAAPHLWEDSGQTVCNLRRCAKHGGYLVLADAYLYEEQGKSAAPGYETLAEIRGAAVAHGDRIVRLIDYGDTLWAANYRTDREAVLRAIDASGDPREREALKRYLDGINQSEQSDVETMGLYCLVLQVDKNGRA